MADDQKDLDNTINDFFLRCGLSAKARDICHVFIELQFPGLIVQASGSQGFCSYTALVGSDAIVQFRPASYLLDTMVTKSAKTFYGSFAPTTRYMGSLDQAHLFVYIMDKMPGIDLRRFRELESSMHPTDAFACRQSLCEDFASFLACAWRSDYSAGRPDGRVGLSLQSRLEKLCEFLPRRFQPIASYLLRHTDLIQELPWVLSHGDVNAGNIMLDPSTGHLSGLVDWTEGETLPFGICLYGLEELLGEMTPSGFVYHPREFDLREAFWKSLKSQIPELDNKETLKAVRMARDLGVLLWHGFAWDDGAIDRVVEDQCERDREEVLYLDAFLSPNYLSTLSEVLPKL